MVEYKTNNFLINEEVNKYLESIIKSKLFANGYIFYGAEEVGKKQTALNFIKEIFKQYDSSGNIEEKIYKNNHPDFLVIEPTSFLKGKAIKNTASEIPKKNNADVIKIDQIRNIKTFLSQRSIESEKKIVLISDAHLLNEAASNCLLKTLEEPNNGIFILLTSQINLLLDTIKSRCQMIRFKSFTKKQIEKFLQNNLDNSELIISKNFTLQDLIQSANGSPGEIINQIDIWNQLSDEIQGKLDFPLNNILEIFKVSKLISEQLEIYQQISLIQLIQQMWWVKTRNSKIITKLEKLKIHIKSHIQPRLAWEVTFLKIKMEDL